MLYRVNSASSDGSYLERQNAITLSKLNLLEADLQKWLKRHLDQVIRTDELLVIKESRPGEEMADILALDATGRLFIFELKRWEADQSNLLQVMRYAQLSNSWRYPHLSKFFKQDCLTTDELSDVHQKHFGLDAPLADEQWNHDQSLVVVTNGLDDKTRKAVKYWRTKGLIIQPWVYRVYQLQGHIYLDINAFGQEDDPYEDKNARYHLVNTNYGNAPIAHHYMLDHARASAFYPRWKHKIDNIEKGDWVFLYQSGAGVVAAGISISDHSHVTTPPHAPDDHGEEHFVELQPFYRLPTPLSATDLREIAGYHIPLISTYTTIRAPAGEALAQTCKERTV